MVDRPSNGYTERFAEAMRSAGRNPDSSKDVGWLAGEIGISYQAMKKVVSGETRMLAADNNVKAAAALGVNSEWLATGAQKTSSLGNWPLSKDLLQAIASAPDAVKRQAENAARNVLDLDPLPRELGGASGHQEDRNPPGKLAA